MIFTYLFEDGAMFRLLDKGFSTEEIWKLEELHGKLKKWVSRND